MGRYPLVCYKHEQHFIICLTTQLHLKVIQWFHKVTAHNAGITQLHNNLHFHFYHPQLTAEIQKQILSCGICQHMKCGAWQYRFLAASDAHAPPRHEIASDCICPWVIELHGSQICHSCANQRQYND